jgi:mannose-6-phosphate isomerase
VNDPYPLLFEPIQREKLWGGSHLAELLGKDAPPDAKIGESWEISDYPELETAVANGPLAGVSLRKLVEERAAAIVGDEAILQGGRFPLLVKYLDAKQTLSVQVHPSDPYAAEHEQGFGKKEAWYIIHVEPDAKLIRGVHAGVSRESFAAALKKGELDADLHAFEPKPGDVVMIPWGTVHAIGAGIVLAEIQQTSDVTYRVYDWNRDDEHGESRDLHVEKALDVIAFERPATDTVERKLLDNGPSKRYEGVRCDKFVIEILELAGSVDDAPPPNRFAILNVVAGEAALESAAGDLPLPVGSTVLIPAAMSSYTLRGDGATVLRSYVP